MAQRIEQVVGQVGGIILGKEHQIRLAIACLIARGHLLIEDIPGVGKTMLAHALATSLGLGFKRIQFTSDLLPADISGYRFTTARPADSSFTRARSLPRSCSPTRSTGRPPRLKARCWRRWRSTR
jgi:MoxR-like ATPase